MGRWHEDERFSSKLSQRRHSLAEMKAMMYEFDQCCAGCAWRSPAIHMLSVDHIVPTSKGGTDDPSNLQLLCHSCNAIKGNRSMAFLQERLREEHPENRVDFPMLLSSLWIFIENSDEGHFVLTNGFGRDAIPFDKHVLIDGESYICKVGCFSRTFRDFRDEKLKTYPFHGLALPYHVFDGVKERSPRVKVEYSISMRVVGGIWKYPPFSFYWHRDSPTSPPDTSCDVLKPSEDPGKHIKFYPQNKRQNYEPIDTCVCDWL